MITLKPKNTFVVGSFQDNPPPPDTSLIIADPVYGTAKVNDIVDLAITRLIPSIIFCLPEDACTVESRPSQVCFWMKPISINDTSKKYSKFVELILMYGVSFYEELHWSDQTGVFNDYQLTNKEHHWKKPEPLIERLIRYHYPGTGVIYDPCAGSRTVESVCKRLGIPSFSVDIQAPF
jgi:hypothetical protein